MNATYRKLLATSAFFVTAALATSASAAQVDCSKPAGRAEARACQAAAQGVDELRRFIQRTQGIYILYMPDYDSAVRV